MYSSNQHQQGPAMSPHTGNKGAMLQSPSPHQGQLAHHVGSHMQSVASRRSQSLVRARAPSPSRFGGSVVMYSSSGMTGSSVHGSQSVMNRNTDSLSSGSVEWMSQYVENGYRPEGDSHLPMQQQADYIAPSPPGGISVIPQSYVMHQELGSGGAGKAFLVTGKLDGKRYVAKQIVCLGEKYKAAPASYALHETRLLFLLQHPHIVELRDFYPKSANYFIVMEFCENGDLARHIDSAIRRGGVKFDADRLFTWWYQTLDAIDYCHSKGVLHRDLKPKNIFLDANFHVKIGDFGVSSLTSFPPALERVGTVTYHAPEVTTSLHYSTKSDVWSIGCIMWETMVLRPQTEPINLQTINLMLLPKAYGSIARDLLVMHLQNEQEHRPSASALKESMLYHLANAGRLAVQAAAEASAAESQARADAYEALMTPRRINIPSGLEKTIASSASSLSDGARAVSSAWPDSASVASGPSMLDGHSSFARDSQAPSQSLSQDLADDLVSYRSSSSASLPQSKDQTSHSSTLLKPSSQAPQEDASGLGIKLVAGEGGEYGAWKIVELEAGKPAALSHEIHVNQYLWEIDGKVIFGMPYQLIASMFRARPGSDVRLGLKEGLGLPIRHIVLRRDGGAASRDASSTHDPASAPNTQAAPVDGSSLKRDTADPHAADSSSATSAARAAMLPPTPKAAPTTPAAAAAGGGGSGGGTAAAAAAVIAAAVAVAEKANAGQEELMSGHKASPQLSRSATQSPASQTHSSPLARSVTDARPIVDDGLVDSPSPAPPSPAIHRLPTPSSSADSLAMPPLGEPSSTRASSSPVADPPSTRSSSSPLRGLVVQEAAPSVAGGGGGGGSLDRLDGTLTSGRALQLNHVRHSPLARPADIDLGVHSTGSPPSRWTRDRLAAGHDGDADDVGRVGSAGSTMTVAGVATIAGDGEYSGELLDGKPFGRGTATWPNQGHTYVGEWRNGVMHGQGTATYLNGDRYDGEWSQGKRSGLGRYAHGSGDVYEGLWSNERKHGLGVDTFADGRGYRGEFRDNKFAGVGSYYTVDGAVYQGDWYQGKAHGSGFSTSAHGGVPTFVQYSHGNLIRSDAFDADVHAEQQARIERQSKAAVAVALLARRIASSIQGHKIPPPFADVRTAEERAFGEMLAPEGTVSPTVLCKALAVLTGIRSGQQDDTSLLIEGLDQDIASLRPLVAQGEVVVEVARRSCSWYKGMSIEDMIVYLQARSGTSLEIGIRTDGSAEWALARRILVPKREPGFIV